MQGKLKGLIRKCLECGKEFEPHRHNHVFCCWKCQYEYKKKRNRKPERKQICKWCLKSFSLYGRPTSKFCSPECSHDFKVVQKRLFNILPFDHKRLYAEFAKLKDQGKAYRFPKDFDEYNSGYYFKELVKNDS